MPASHPGTWQVICQAHKHFVCPLPQEAIRQVLVHLWEKHEEVPFIAAYRKSLAADLRR